MEENSLSDIKLAINYHGLFQDTKEHQIYLHPMDVSFQKSSSIKTSVDTTFTYWLGSRHAQVHFIVYFMRLITDDEVDLGHVSLGS